MALQPNEVLEPPTSILDLSKLIVSRIPGALYGGVRGDPNAETTAGRYIPGVVQQTVGQLGEWGTEGYNGLRSIIPPVFGYAPQPPVEPPEFVSDATRHAGGALKAAQGQLGLAIEPRNAIERTVAAGVDAAGQSLPLPSSLGRMLPNAARGVGALVTPSLVLPKFNAALQGGTAAVGQGIAEYNQAETRHAAMEKPLLELPTDAPAQPTAQKQLLDLPTAVSSLPPAPPKSLLELPDDTKPGVNAPPITAQQPDQTGLTFGQGLALATGSLAAISLASPLGRVVGAARRAMRAGETAKLNEAIGLRTGDPNVPVPPGYNPTNPPPLPDVPVPGSGGIGTRAVTAFVDEQARAKGIAEAYAESPQEARALQAALGQFGDKQAANTRARELLATGVDWITKDRLPAVERYIRRIGADLPETKQNLLNTGLYAANELDDRAEMVRQALMKGQQATINDPEMRHALWTTDTPTLKAQVAAARADPDVLKFMDEFRTIDNAYLRHYNEKRGLISDSDASNMRAIRPNHVSRMSSEGKLLQVFGERELQPRGGPTSIEHKAWDALQQQTIETARSADLNDRNRQFLEAIGRGQARDPSLNIIATRRQGYAGEAIDDPQSRIIRVHTRNGPEAWEIHDPVVYHLLSKGDSMLPVMVGAAAHMSQTLQSSITGPLSMFAGRLFSLTTNLPRSIISAASERPTGYAGSLSDKALQAGTGGRVGSRVLDPTTPVGVGYQLSANMSAMFAKGLADALERGTGPTARLLQGAAGRDNVLKFSDWLNDRYISSILHKQRSGGLGGQGARASVEVNSTLIPRGIGPKYLGEALRAPPSPIHSAVPELFQPRGFASAIRAKRMVNDFNNLINDGMHSYFYRLNRGKPTVELAYETSQLTGAPGTQGASMRNWNATVPYLNPSIQGVARMARSYKESPFGTAFGKVATYGMILAAEQMLATIGGPEHVRALDEVPTPEQKADSIFLNFSGNPLGWSLLSVPQQDRWIIEPLRQFIKHVFGIQPQMDESTVDLIKRGFEEWFGSYMSQSTAKSAIYGATQNIDPILQPPLPIQMGAIATGNQLRPQIHHMIDAIEQHRPLLGQKGTLTQPISEPYKLPGQDASYNSGGDAGVINALGSAAFGQAMATAKVIWGEATRADTLGGFFAGAKDAYQQRVRDLNQLATGVLWPNAPVVQPRGHYPQQQVMNTLINLRELQGVEKGAQQQGMTRQGGLPIPVTGASLYPTDPIMQQVFDVGTGLFRHLENDVVKHITDLDKQRQHIDDVPMSQADKREQSNRIATEIHQSYLRAAEIVQLANQRASEIAGAPIDYAQHIDWRVGSKQFAVPALLAQPQQQKLLDLPE